MKFNAKPIYENECDLYTCRGYVEAATLLRARAIGYHSILASSLTVVATSAIDTAGTDGYYLYINVDYFLGLPNVEQRAFLLGHEAAHAALQHMRRGKAFKQRGTGPDGRTWDHTLYNVAADFVINADLIAAGLEIMDGALSDPRFSRDDLVDSVYIELANERAEQEPEPPEPGEPEPGEPEPGEGEPDDAGEGEPGDGEPDDGQGKGEQPGEAEPDGEPDGDDGQGQGDRAGHDHHLEPQYSGTAEEQERAEQDDGERVERAVDTAIEAQAEAYGETEERMDAPSAALAAAGRQGSANAKADWRSELAEYLTKAGRGGLNNPARIHRRRFNTLGVISPAAKGAIDMIAVTVDISGSVNTARLTAFIAEVAQALDVLQPTSGAQIILCNHDVRAVAEVHSGAELLDLEISRGGGTDLPKAVKWLEQNGYQPDLHLVFTDGEFGQRDWHKLAAADAVIVMDRQPGSHRQRQITNAGAAVIVADAA
jgi:predicted metal-dependent peptidase